MSTTLYTPTLSVETKNSASYTVGLYVLNASCSERTGTLEIVTLDGTVVGSGSYSSLQPNNGTGAVASSFAGAPAITLLYGRVTVDDAPNSIRANLAVRDAKGNTLVSLDAE